jgi:hypothetical protein
MRINGISNRSVAGLWVGSVCVASERQTWRVLFVSAWGSVCESDAKQKSIPGQLVSGDGDGEPHDDFFSCGVTRLCKVRWAVLLCWIYARQYMQHFMYALGGGHIEREGTGHSRGKELGAVEGRN